MLFTLFDLKVEARQRSLRVFFPQRCVHVRQLPIATNSDFWRTCSLTPSRTGSRHRAILLRESYREGSRVKKRTLANLSQLPQLLIDGIRKLIAGGTVAMPEAGKQDDHGFKIVRRASARPRGRGGAA